MLWRYGVPRLFKAVPAHGYARLVGRIGHLVRHRGAFLVVVRVDPSDQIDAPTSRLWEFGPFPREKATGVRDGLGKAIDEGRWVPLARS
jgi:hypothetical protein